MKFARRQRGQLLVAGIVLIVVVALMISTLGFLYVSTQSASTLHGSSGTAYYAARSGIEVASYQFSSGTSCAALTSGAQTVGTNASFSIAATLYNVAPPTANNTTITSTQTFIPIAAGAIASYAPSGRVRIGTEEIDYSAQSTDSTTCGGAPPCLVVSQRGAAGTTAAAHAARPVYQNLCHVRSTGSSGAATRFVDRTLHDPASMMVYAKIGSAVPAADYPRPFYRFWTGAAWGAEQTNANNFGLSGVGSTIRWTVVKMARTRNEVILATVHDEGSIRLQIWDGFQWFVPAGLGAGGQLTTALGGDDAYRGVYIAYETASDRAIIAYNNGTRNPQYRTWDGSTLSAQMGVDSGADLGANYPTSGRPRWIRLAANPLPTSNEVVMITLDSNADTSGIRWDGSASAWRTMESVAPTVWFNNVSNGTSTVEAIAVAYEQNSGRAMFMWADSSNDDTTYRLWNGTVPIGATNTLNINAMGGRGQWLRLIAQPNSNNLLYGVQDSGADLNTRYWNGFVWDAQAQHFPEHDNSVEQTTNRVFDLVFETHPTQINNAWIVWADGAQVSAKKFTLTSCGGNCWGATTNRGDDTSRIDLEANPGTGDVFSLSYESSLAVNPEEILEMRLTGGGAVWTGTTPIWAGRNDTYFVTDGRQHLVSRRQIRIVTREYFP